LMRMQDTEQVVCQLSIATLCRKIGEKRQSFAVLGGKAAKKRPLSCLSGLRLLKLAISQLNLVTVLT
jgi:hypothetical protein